MVAFLSQFVSLLSLALLHILSSFDLISCGVFTLFEVSQSVSRGSRSFMYSSHEAFVALTKPLKQ